MVADDGFGEPGTSRGPRVLFVTPSFFGYERVIAESFDRQGCDIELLDERVSNASWVKAVARVAPSVIGLLTRRHFERALERARKDPPDLVVVVKAEVVPRAFLRALRELNPHCVFAFYAFDSFANSPRGADLLDEFDHAFSFDRGDVGARGLTYKPLFHAPEFTRARTAAADDGRSRRDLAFVGTVHSGRWSICQRLFAAGRDNQGFFYSPARWHHAVQWLTRRDVRRIPWSDVSFVPLSRAEVAGTFAHARAVIDVQRNGQSGLTMRTFEVLAAGAGLVTTNPSVAEEGFYDPRWVHVLTGPPTGWDLAAVSGFLAGIEGAPPERLSSYSLDEWVRGFIDLRPTATRHAP